MLRMNRPSRLLLATVATRSMSKSSKPPTKSQQSHYETLEINSQATQGEIKTAYFKLSKQYHPDKNSSEEATAKFRDVAEAYEILGSYESRRHYDRSILTRANLRTPRETSTSTSSNDDPKMKYYQTQAAVFRHQQKSGSAPIYDFDAWTKAHYGRTLYRTFKEKELGAYRKMEREELAAKSLASDYLLIIVSFLFIVLTVSFGLSDKSKDNVEYPQKSLTDREFRNNVNDSIATNAEILPAKAN